MKRHVESSSLSDEVVVQKFGGTSLATQEAREKAVATILNSYLTGFKVVVVVSAMGRYPDPYATDTLIKLLNQTSLQSSSAIQDLLLSCGEVISACIVGQMLENKKIPVAVLSWHYVGIITDSYHGNAWPLAADITRIREELAKSKVVILPGFQGVTPNRHITTLGRGGSDLTAIVLGAALETKKVEIYTDVDGVKTADPNIIPNARTLPEITYEEMGELANNGAKVMHARAVALAIQEEVPITISQTGNNLKGTKVVKRLVKPEKIITGIAHVAPMAFAKVKFSSINSQKETKELLTAFANSKISLDMIHITQEHAYFIFKEEYLRSGHSILGKKESTIEKGFAKISIVGAGMRGVPGIMAQIIEALEKEGISIYHSTDSHITISCLVKEEELKKAVNALINQFKLNGEPKSNA